MPHVATGHAEKLVGYLEGQGHSAYSQDTTVWTMFSVLMILLQANLVWWYKYWIAVFKINVTADIENFN